MHTSLKSNSKFARSVCIIFLSALILNALYENAHAFLYVHYQGGAISEGVLLHAALADAFIITALSLVFFYFERLARLAWLIVPLGFVVAIGIEWWALGTGRWAYGLLMPIIPLLGTGLTPTIQLGLLGYASYWFAKSVTKRCEEKGVESGGLPG